MENCGLSSLLQFRDAALEDRWRTYSNAKLVDWDKLWTLNIFLVSAKVYSTNWEHVSLLAVVVHMALSITLFSVLLLWLQIRHADLYVKWRVPIVMAVRLSRDLCTSLFLGPIVATVCPVAAAAAGASCLRLAFPEKTQILYTMSRLIAYPLPFKLQLPSILLVVLAGLSTLPERCAAVTSDAASNVWTENCTMKWMAVFERGLGRLWVFNIALDPSLRPSITPVDACLLTQQVSLVAIGALAPLLIYSTMEEDWRLTWLSPDGNAPLRPSVYKRAVYDVALFLLGSAMIYQMCLMVANWAL